VFDGRQDGSSDTLSRLDGPSTKKSIACQCFFRQISAADGCSDTYDTYYHTDYTGRVAALTDVIEHGIAAYYATTQVDRYT